MNSRLGEKRRGINACFALSREHADEPSTSNILNTSLNVPSIFSHRKKKLPRVY